MNIFRRPIGTIHDLGTPRSWIIEAICMALCFTVVIAALLSYDPHRFP